jgi:hypothetical protein
VTTPPPDRDDDGSVDVEAAWADIVARWDAEQPPVGKWPASEDTSPEETAPEQATADGPEADAGQPGPGDEVAGDWGRVGSHVGGEPVRAAAAAPEPDEDEDEEEGYVPPEPPPLPRGDVFTTLAWAGVLGAPLFFLFTALFWRSVPQLLIVAAIAAFVGGFVTLVLRMPDRRDEDDHDDGAVV